MTDRPNQIVMASTYDDEGTRVVLLAWYPEDRNIPSEYSAHYQDVEGFCYSGSYYAPGSNAYNLSTALRLATEAFDERVAKRGLTVAA